MSGSAIDVATVSPIRHREAMVLAATEFDRMIDQLRRLSADDWLQPTVCEPWTVRDLTGHVLGMAEMGASWRQLVSDFRNGAKRGSGALIDGVSAHQVEQRAHLSAAQVVERLAEYAPKAVRARRRIPAPLRWAVRMKQDDHMFDGEWWQLGYLADQVATRDTWMHRLDICRAVGRDMTMTAEHDGRMVAGVVADWARRHGRPFQLTLTGPVGGHWSSGHGGEAIELDALEFCWTLSGRATGPGLLSTRTPF
jgi:uncharacterized protein (TIGR03083 family)